jgi:TusA-related sulfurtransferase
MEGLRALIQLNDRGFSADAHALGILSALDRVKMARGLPRHVEIYATAPAFELLFGVAPPATPPDPTIEVLPRVWIEYLTRVAASAGHPVPDTAAQPRDRVRLAWAGMLEGSADKLLRDGAGASDTLRPVVEGAARRLTAEAIADRNAFAAEQRQRAAQHADLSGEKEHGMANCPSAIAGAATRTTDLKDGIAVEVTAKDPAVVAEIRRRAERQTEVAKHPTKQPHTGAGGDTGEIGFCPIVLVGTTVTSENLPNGARLTVRTTDQANVRTLQQTTKERVDALRRTGP